MLPGPAVERVKPSFLTARANAHVQSGLRESRTGRGASWRQSTRQLHSHRHKVKRKDGEEEEEEEEETVLEEREMLLGYRRVRCFPAGSPSSSSFLPPLLSATHPTPSLPSTSPLDSCSSANHLFPDLPPSACQHIDLSPRVHGSLGPALTPFVRFFSSSRVYVTGFG